MVKFLKCISEHIRHIGFLSNSGNEIMFQFFFYFSKINNLNNEKCIFLSADR